jgi:hypothetical protein
VGFLRDLTRKLRKLDPLTDWAAEKTASLPGTPGSMLAAIESDAPSGNIFGPEASKFDIFAGGTKLSRSSSNRAAGRAVGTFFAAGAGAGLSTSTAAQAGAGAASASLGASGAAEAEDDARAADDAAAAGASEAAAKATEAARMARDRADSINLEERRRRQAFGRSINPTGGMGDPDRANLASRFLLGV